jgi:hypothetical protein
MTHSLLGPTATNRNYTIHTVLCAKYILVSNKVQITPTKRNENIGIEIMNGPRSIQLRAPHE